MSIETDLFAALKGLVGNRVYAVNFPQAENMMTWPAIRYSFVGIVPAVTVCGDGGDDGAEVRVQLDLVHTDAASLRALRLQVMQAMRGFDPPAVNENSLELFDGETRTYRGILDYLIHPSG